MIGRQRGWLSVPSEERGGEGRGGEGWGGSRASTTEITILMPCDIHTYVRTYMHMQ